MNWKLIAAATGGLVTGLVTGWAVTRKLMEQRLEDLVDEEIELFKEGFYDLQEARGLKHVVPHPEEEDLTLPKEARDKIVFDEGYSTPAEERLAGIDELEAQFQDRLDTSATPGPHLGNDGEEVPGVVITRPTPKQRAKEVHVVNDQDLPQKDDKHPEKPYVIPIGDFMQDEDYEKIEVTYFQEDDILIDVIEDIIPDPEKCVGNDSLTRFGVLSDDNNKVYVRNDWLKADYEITLDKRSYSEVVLGYREPPEPMAKPKKKQRTDAEQ